MMYLSKERTNKNQNLKMQMMLSLDKDDTSNNSDKIWRRKKKCVFSRRKRGFYNQIFLKMH